MLQRAYTSRFCFLSSLDALESRYETFKYPREGVEGVVKDMMKCLDLCRRKRSPAIGGITLWKGRTTKKKDRGMDPFEDSNL